MKIPQQGDIYWMNLSPTKGHEQAGKRPCYVLSPAIYNRIGLCLVCPITSNAKGYGGEYELPKYLKTEGVVLTDHIRNVDWKQRSMGYFESFQKQDRHTLYLRINTLLKPQK